MALDSLGRIHFTDPCYGDRSQTAQFDSDGHEVEGVYRLDPNGSIQRIITYEVDRPNGIVVSPDGNWLFLADNVNDGDRALSGNRKLWRFNLDAAGRIVAGSREMLFDWGSDRGPDGLAIKTANQLYVAAGFNFGKPPIETTKIYRTDRLASM